MSIELVLFITVFIIIFFHHVILSFAVQTILCEIIGPFYVQLLNFSSSVLTCGMR